MDADRDAVRRVMGLMEEAGHLNGAQIERDTTEMGLKISTQSLGQFLESGTLGQERVNALWRWITMYISKLLHSPEVIALLKTDLAGEVRNAVRDPNGPAELPADAKCLACGNWTPRLPYCGQCGKRLAETQA